MTTVGEMFHSLDRDEVLAAILRLYRCQPGAHPEGYVQAWDIIRAKQSATPTDMVCEIYMHPSFDDDEPAMPSVHGRSPDDPDSRYAIEYNPWSEWLSMEVDVLLECGVMSPTDALAHIFWEMTWAGYDDNEIADQKQEILDRVDEVKEMIDADPPKHS